MRHVGHIGRSLFLLAVTLPCSTRAFPSQSIPAKLPLVFESNRGQAPGNVRYLLREGVLKGEFLNDGLRLALPGSEKTPSQVQIRLVGARKDAAIDGGGALEGHTNYLLGNAPTHWLRGVPNYAQVRYSQIYSGTDLVFYGNDGALEHDFVLQPGADPSRIAFQLDGAESVTLDENGDLRIGLAGGAMTFQRPIAYQTVAGSRRNVDAAFTVDKEGTIRFRLGSYDAREKLVIDPVLSFSTYLSSLAPDGNLIATDASGNNYVSGYATLGFPVTSSAFAGCANCTTNSVVTFISKLSADGTSLIYSTVLGGNSFAQPTGIAVDGNGNVLVSGWTGATDFPTKNGQPIAAQNNSIVGYLVSLSPDGSSLNYGTLLSSSPSSSQSATTYATAVALDSSGNAYVTGDTGNGFFTTAGALNQGGGGNFGNEFNVYLAKFSPTGTLIYSAVLGAADPQHGGVGPIGASAIAVDADGDAFVAGQAGILWPISSNAYLKQIAGSMPYATPFVTEVAPDAKSLVYSTYLDYAYVVTGIAVLSNGNVFVTGNEVGESYPTTSNAYQQNSGGGNAFLTELNSTGSGLAYSTVVGDSSYKINGLALDANGDIWLAAQTSNPLFPLVTPIQGTFPVTGPASVLNEFDPTGQTLKFSTFLGGDAPGFASSVAVDANQKVHVSGAAQYGMYTTPGVYAGSVPTPGSGFSEATYAYVSLIDPATSTGILCLNSTGLSFGYLLPQTSASQSMQVSNCGNAPLTISSIASNNAAFTVPASSNGCTGSIPVRGSCTVSVVFGPTAVQAYSGQLTFTSNSSIATTSITLSGSGGEPAAGFGPPGTTQELVFSPMLVGQTSPAEFIGLYNNGTAPLKINLSQISVTSGFELAAGGTCTATLPAGQYCGISVAFAPTTAGTFNGMLTVSSNDPVHPTISTSLTGTAFASYPIATITALLNPSYPFNSGTTPITMSVYGTNFFPASVVYLNGVAQTTGYQSGTFLTVTFSPTLLTAVGQIPVTVVNPSPGGGSSAPYPLIEYLAIPLTASALTVDPVGGLLYAAIPASAAQNPNTVIPINPATGATMTPIAVASGPRALAVSDDGSELYVASAGVLQRYNLTTQLLEKTFNLPVDSEWGQTYVQEMHVVPGSPHSIVVELFANVDPSEDGAALYNDSGLVNWIQGVGGTNWLLMLDSFTFTSPTTIYGLPEGASFFGELQVSTTGLSVVSPGGVGCCDESTGSIVRSDGTLLYTNSGEVWDPSTQKLLGTYLSASGCQLFYTASVVPDTANGNTYFLDGGGQYANEESLGIDVYNQANYTLVGVVPFLSIYSPDATDLVRWGTNGFAFRTVDITGQQPSANQIVIVTSSLIAPSSATPVPILSSVSPSPVYAGGPAYTMQVTGSGFTSASTVLVNGNPRATTYISGTSLTAQVLASDIASTGQINVQVTTPAPGGGTSNYVIVSIEPPLQTAPTVTVTPSTTSITTAQALTVTVALSGTPTPTGSVQLTGGGYTSTQTLSSGSTQFSIIAGSLSAGSDTFTANYTPDSNSSSTYNSATGTSSTVTVTVPANPSPVIGSLSPTFTSAGGAAFTLTVTGSGFVSGSTVYWGTSALTTTYGSATQLTAQVPASDIASAGNTAVTVQTPSPGGGTSNALQFEVDSIGSGSTPPTFTTLTATVTAGSPASYSVTLPSTVESATITCLNLPAGATCSYSSTTNTVTITTSATTPAGTYQVTVVFNETVSGASTSWILLPILLLPLVFLRKKLAARGVWVTACLGLVLLVGAAVSAPAAVGAGAAVVGIQAEAVAAGAGAGRRLTR
jgi:hypothetical protein